MVYYFAAILVSVCSSVPFILSLSTAKKVHENLLFHIMRAPLVTFFECTPIGRILVRFTRDTDVVDRIIPMQLKNYVQRVVEVGASLIEL